MKRCWILLLVAMSLPAAAQSADALYQQACGPKDAKFVVQVAKGQPPAGPEPGKALVYFIQKDAGMPLTTRVGLDGTWVGVAQRDSYIFASVTPGDHHACAATTNTRHPQPELVHFKAEAGKVYYFLLRGIGGTVGYGEFYSMEFVQVDRDEALYLIATDPQSVAKPASLER
jgi:hypothetical protein